MFRPLLREGTNPRGWRNLPKVCPAATGLNFCHRPVLEKAPSQPPCREDTGNKEGIVLLTQMDGSENSSGKYLPPTGHTSPCQVLCSFLLSLFLSLTVSKEIRPINLTFVPRSSQYEVSVKCKCWCKLCQSHSGIF